MFFSFAEYPYQTNSKCNKFYGELFWNICDFWEVESTQGGARGPHEAPGHARGAQRAVVPCEALVGRLVPLFGCKEANIQKKIVLKFQRNRSYGSPGI